MTQDQAFRLEERATISPIELKQVKEAISELRASDPRSILADLVEAKIRTIDQSRLFPTTSNDDVRDYS